MKNLIFTTCLVLFPFFLFAQNGVLTEEKWKEFEAQKVAFYTKEMNLTPDEASKFWPLYNEMQQKIEVIRKNEREAIRGRKDRLTEKEAQNIVNTILETQGKELEIRKEYYKKIESVTSANKLLLMLETERRFHRQLMKKIGTYTPLNK